MTRRPAQAGLRVPILVRLPSRCSAARLRSRRSSAAAAGGPPRRRRASARSSSTWIAFIGSTYGLRSRIERCTTGCRSSSSSASTIASTASTVRACSAGERVPEALRLGAVRDEREVRRGDLEARLRERHLEVLDECPEERPLARRAGAARRAARLRARRVEGRAAAEPGGQQAAVLRPGEHPRDRAQRLELAGRRRLGPRRPAASRSRAAPARRSA